MAENQKNNKPRQPAPPLNAKGIKTNPRKSVYDDIAERRRSEPHKIGVSVPSESDGDVKVYKREKSALKPERKAVRITEEENFDIPIPPPKRRKKIGFWAVVIIVLGALCAAAAIAYCAVNGVFDGLIKML